MTSQTSLLGESKATDCPTCYISRPALIEMMAEEPHDGLETENHAMARKLIAACPDCRDWWKRIIA